MASAAKRRVYISFLAMGLSDLSTFGLGSLKPTHIGLNKSSN